MYYPNWNYWNGDKWLPANGIDLQFQDIRPPCKLELKLSGKAKEHQGKYYGTYDLGKGQVNGYPYWLSTDESKAIYVLGTSWLVSEKEYLGKDRAYIKGLIGEDAYPNDIKKGWKYWNGKVHQNASESDIIFNALGKHIFISKLCQPIQFANQNLGCI